MSQFLLYAFVAVILFCLGLYSLLASPHLVRKIMALNIMGSAAFLFLVGVARRNVVGVPDPVPHAMVLTGIVIALAASALALALARRIYRLTGHTRLPDEGDLS